MIIAEKERLKKRNQYHRDTLGDARVNKTITWDEIHNEIIGYANSLSLDKVRLLDAGAGEGRYREILKDIINIEYIGVDSGVGSDEWDFSKIIKSNLSEMPFIDDESVDITIMIQVLSHVKDLDESIQEIAKKMKKGSLIFIGTQNMQSLTHIPYDFVRLTPYGIQNIFERHGVILEKVQPQLYGDNVSAAKQLEYVMLNNILSCERCGWIIKTFSKGMILFLKAFYKLLKQVDKKRDMPLNPVGYFAVLRKV